MKHQFLKDQLPLLVSIEATTMLHRASLIPHSKGFSIEITGNPAKTLLKNIFEFFEGYLSKEQLPLPPLDVKPISTFTLQVLQYLTSIPLGSVETYASVAHGIGCKKGARAVGGACSRNPFLFFVPCHRVIGQKNLCGFAAGSNIKKILLEFEES
jgi:O-6-methylguanine DNA methyltransferase